MGDSPVISRRLREARLAAGMSQKQLGIAAGIDEFSASPRINQYERGKHVPDFSIAEKLAAVLNVPTPYLFTRDDELAQLILWYGQLDAAAKVRMLEIATSANSQHLADKANIDRSYMGGIERGEHNIAIMNFLKIADALGIKASSLLDKSGSQLGQIGIENPNPELKTATS